MSDKGTRVGGPLYEARKRAELDNPGSQPPVRQQVSERRFEVEVLVNVAATDPDEAAMIVERALAGIGDIAGETFVDESCAAPSQPRKDGE